MEPRFEVVTPIQKEQYRALAESVHQKQHTAVVYLVLMIVAGVGAMCSALIMDVGATIFLLVFCGWFSFRYARFSALQTNAMWDAHNTAMDIAPVTFRFDDTYLYDNHPLTATTTDYRLLTELVETDEYFLLYISKHSAYILPKASFTVGTPEDFRLFISQKTGKPVTPLADKKLSSRRTLWAVLVPVLAVVLSIVIGIVGMIPHAVVTTAEDGTTLTMEVPLYLTWDDYEPGYNYLYSDDVDIVIDYWDNDTLRKLLPGEITQEALAQYLIDEGYVDEYGEWQQASDGTLSMSYYFDGFYCETYLFWTDGDCYRVEFSCNAEDAERYATDFAAWRSTIVVEEGAA